MNLPEIINALQSGSGRLIAAALIFALMWAIKSVPWVEVNVLTTPRRRQLAVAFLATAPAATMLAGDVCWVDCLVAFGTIFAEAMGIHVGVNVLAGKPVGVVVVGGPDKKPDPPAGAGGALTGGLAVVVLALMLVGCGSAAIQSVNTAREVEVSMGESLKQECTDEYAKVTTAEQLRNLDDACVPARAVYGSLRTARLTALALLVAKEACEEGDAPSCAKADPAALAAALGALAGAVESAAATAAALEK